MNIIGKQETLLSLFPGDLIGKLTNGVTAAVHKSFQEQNMRDPTRDEIRRRFDICVRWAKTLRGDLKWGIQRIVDEMPEALRSELLGVRYQPSDRKVWAPIDGG